MVNPLHKVELFQLATERVFLRVGPYIIPVDEITEIEFGWGPKAFDKPDVEPITAAVQGRTDGSRFTIGAPVLVKELFDLLSRPGTLLEA